MAMLPLPEKFAFLIKDRPIQLPADFDQLPLFAKEMRCFYPAYRFGESEEDKNATNSVMALMKELRRTAAGGPIPLLLRAIRHSTVSTVLLGQEFVERLCQILPKPFLDIQIQLIVPESEETVKKRQRVELDELLRDAFKETTRVPILFIESITRNIICDVILGWEPTKRVTTTRMDTISFMGNLFAMDSSKDVKIVAGNGVEIKCHRIVIEAHSDVLAAMLSPRNGMKESQTGRIELKENSEEGLSLLIRYLYGQELTSDEFSCDVGIELFKFAHKYGLAGLEGFLLEMLLQKGDGWFEVDELLELYFHVKDLDVFQPLQKHLLDVMKSSSQAIRGCQRFKELQESDGKGAWELAWKLVDWTYTLKE